MKLLVTPPLSLVMLLPPLLLLLLCFTAVRSSGPVQTCCLKTTDTILPLSKIAGYYRQKAGLCPVDAVVFITVKNVKICSGPDKLWVKRAVKYFGGKKTKDGKKAMPPQQTTKETPKSWTFN